MERADYQQQADEERRRQEEEARINDYACAMIDRDKDAWPIPADNLQRGEHVYTRTASGLYRNTSRDEPKGIWK